MSVKRVQIFRWNGSENCQMYFSFEQNLHKSNEERNLRKEDHFEDYNCIFPHQTEYTYNVHTKIGDSIYEFFFVY